MKTYFKRILIIGIVATVLSISACGGGSSGGVEPNDGANAEGNGIAANDVGEVEDGGVAGNDVSDTNDSDVELEEEIRLQAIIDQAIANSFEDLVSSVDAIGPIANLFGNASILIPTEFDLNAKYYEFISIFGTSAFVENASREIFVNDDDSIFYTISTADGETQKISQGTRRVWCSVLSTGRYFCKIYLAMESHFLLLLSDTEDPENGESFRALGHMSFCTADTSDSDCIRRLFEEPDGPAQLGIIPFSDASDMNSEVNTMNVYAAEYNMIYVDQGRVTLQSRETLSASETMEVGEVLEALVDLVK